MGRWRSSEAVTAYAALTFKLAEGPTERAIARLVGQWARWSFRWSVRPTEANSAREERAWQRLRTALTDADMEDTWLDPRD